MSTLTFGTLVVCSNFTYGSLDVIAADQKLSITLTQEECARFMPLALELWASRQQALADAIRTAQPALLPAPSEPAPSELEVAYTDFTPVPEDDQPL